ADRVRLRAGVDLRGGLPGLTPAADTPGRTPTTDSRESAGRRGGRVGAVLLDHDTCYRAVTAKDARFDGQFVTAVRTTGIYCRPSCPVPPPKTRNVEFLRTAAAAQSAGYRACRRCRPDAVPGS